MASLWSFTLQFYHLTIFSWKLASALNLKKKKKVVFRRNFFQILFVIFICVLLIRAQIKQLLFFLFFQGHQYNRVEWWIIIKKPLISRLLSFQYLPLVVLCQILFLVIFFMSIHAVPNMLLWLCHRFWYQKPKLRLTVKHLPLGSYELQNNCCGLFRFLQSYTPYFSQKAAGLMVSGWAADLWA